MIILATFQVHSHHIPGHSRSIPATFQVHSHHTPGSSHHIPATFQVHSRSIPTIFQVIPGPLQVHSSHILGTFQPYSWSIPGQFIILYINYLIHGFNIEPPNIWHSKRVEKNRMKSGLEMCLEPCVV